MNISVLLSLLTIGKCSFMYNFCTLFDSNYLHKGLALYKSLCNTCEEFHLFIVAFDDNCYATLKNLNLDRLTVASLAEFETKELLAIKKTRNRAEYCWTAGPSVIFYFIQKYSLDHCTYVDSDLMFFTSPKVVFDEIGNNSVAITEHIPGGTEMPAGKYCVQFVYFKNDLNGIKALTWWMNSCIDWCFAKYEDGKYGDQMYLNSFSELFNNVHVIRHRGAGVAPWNIHLYDFSIFGKIGFESQFFEIIFFHFHGTQINLVNNELEVNVITSDVDKYLETNIYNSYLELLSDIYKVYLNRIVLGVKVRKRNFIKRVFARLKATFKNSLLVRFIYFDILRIKYNGYQN